MNKDPRIVEKWLEATCFLPTGGKECGFFLCKGSKLLQYKVAIISGLYSVKCHPRSGKHSRSDEGKGKKKLSIRGLNLGDSRKEPYY